MHWLVKTSDLPPPLVNAAVLGYVVDRRWPAQRLIVEVDSITRAETGGSTDHRITPARPAA